MSAFNEQPGSAYDNDMPLLQNTTLNSDNQTVQSVQLSPTGYASMLTAIVILYAICALVISYLIWERISRRKALRLYFQGTTPRDLEKNVKQYEKHPEAYTPGTVVGSEVHHSPQFQTVHLGRSASSPASQSFFEEENLRFPLPPPATRDVGSPGTASSPASSTSQPTPEASDIVGLSIGDRLRSHLMVREITGGLPPSADALVAATLGVNMDRSHSSHSRSSLFTIAELSAEASPSSTPGAQSPSRSRSRSLMPNPSRTASLG